MSATASLGMTMATPDAAWLDGLAARATRVDGQPPFSDQARLELRDGRRELLTIDADAAAILLRGSPGELELVVDPSARRRGLGRALLQRTIDENPHLLAWAHGDHPGARVLAETTGFSPARTLLQLRAPVAAVTDDRGDALRGVERFEPGVDDGELLAVNAAAFADHPEQGSLNQGDFDARMAEPWFDPADVLLIRDRDGLAGFCWLKVEGEVGEFYVVGVEPSRQGSGLGRRLVRAGLARLASQSIRTASLYVEADNVAAVRLYRSFGFADHTIDVQYRRDA